MRRRGGSGGESNNGEGADGSIFSLSRSRLVIVPRKLEAENEVRESVTLLTHTFMLRNTIPM